MPILQAEKSYIERASVSRCSRRAWGHTDVSGCPHAEGRRTDRRLHPEPPEVRPFTDKQIALVTSFAAQAVIAIENARLLNELRQRTDELGRSVGELRALGEVSQAVNSTLDLETVLSTIVAKAVQLSGTEAGAIYVFDELAARISPACDLWHGSGVDRGADDSSISACDEPNVTPGLRGR